MLKKRKIFLELSRRKRRSLVVQLKNRMNKQKAEFGGKFWSDSYFNTINNNPERTSTRHWIDIVFPSKKDPSILWNATVLTVYEELNDHYVLKKEKNEDFYKIFERYEIYKDYVYGIGLTIVVNEKDLNQEAVERAIENFYQAGEKAWISPNPVDKEKLIDGYENIFKNKNEGAAILILE